ncbi:MAG: hypothetical protein E7098_07795 [Mediterranea massiliensis]|nr:hypothetical protein [Mediterranea massiliensis]
MDILLIISQFFYRIRYWLLWGTLIVTGLVIYFTQFLPFSYTVKSNLYTGVSSTTTLDGSTINYAAINSTFDNLIGIAQSHSTLANVSHRLLADSYTYGEEWKDNEYIQAKHYRQLLDMTPPEVLELVNRDSVEVTLRNLKNYYRNDRNNFLYNVFNRPINFYSLQALNNIEIKRVGNSDILDISYTSADPGLTQKTVKYLIDELIAAYEEIRFKATNDVIAYFEEQVRKTKAALNVEEDDLMRYNVAQGVINYNEETEALSLTRYEVDDRMEEVRRRYEGAVALREVLDEKMDIRAQIIRSNTNLLKELDQVTKLNQQILEREIFDEAIKYSSDNEVEQDKLRLKQVEANISNISDNLNEINYTKEGVGVEDMIVEWLNALVNEAKAKAELKVMQARQQDIREQYAHMAPVGTQVNRKERSIGIAEDNYRVQLKGLADANLRLKNIQMSTSNLQPLSDPAFPLNDNGRKRMLYIIIAFIGSFVFITCFFLLIEVLDRTLRDKYRSQRLSGLPVIAAFNGISNLKYRGFLRACNRAAAAYSCRRLNKYFKQNGEPTIINLLSVHSGEGKSFLAEFFMKYWKAEGLNVKYLNYETDFDVINNKYIQASKLTDFWQPDAAEAPADLILVEYPSFNNCSVPLPVMQEADVNLLVANACRLWRDSDTATIDPLKEALEGKPFMMYLNNADREVVESFTGELPPHTAVHSFLSRLAQFGFTSQQNAVR